MEFLITSQDDFYTSRLCPWEQTNELNVAWNVWKFNKVRADNM